MKKDIRLITQSFIRKMSDSIFLVEHSVKNIPVYNTEKLYSPDELEPFDALCDRFIRSVEICLKFFKTYEKYMFGENSDTIRDLLNRMEKLGIINSTEQWLDMRDVRNRIVHDYLPEELKEIYDSISTLFYNELVRVKKKALEINID